MKKNGFFQVINGEQTTSIKIFPPEDGGEPVKLDEIRKYLDDCFIKEYDLQEVQDMLQNCSGMFEAKILNAKVWAVNEKMELLFDRTRRFAAAKFYPPSSEGKYMDKRDIIDELRSRGIVHGILAANIDSYLKNRQFGMNILLARATLPVEGQNAEIEYFFRVGNTSKPKLKEDGSVDFHDLDNMTRVQKGEVLAKLKPAVLGTPGMDIMGNRIMPKKVKQKVLKKTNQTDLSEDGLTLYSRVSGHVNLVEGKVFVSDTYEVPADVDASTGDIHYDGNVTVRGNVRTGYCIRAKGTIVVDGVVEGASLYADGDIILKRGIQGMNRGCLEAKGNVVTKFIENSTVKSGDTVQTEAILHSQIEAKNQISVVGRKGLVTGGELKAGSLITLKVAGSTMGTTTVLEVGIDPEISDRYIKIQQDINDKRQEKIKLEQIFELLKKKMEQGARLPADKAALVKMLPDRIKTMDNELNELLESYLELKDQMDEMNNGNIVVENMAYPGVKIIISNLVKFVRTVEHHSKYYKEDGEVKNKPL